MAESLLTPSGMTLSSFKGNSASEAIKQLKRPPVSQNVSLQAQTGQVED